jgi:hypothetical protein
MTRLEQEILEVLNKSDKPLIISRIVEQLYQERGWRHGKTWNSDSTVIRRKLSELKEQAKVHAARREGQETFWWDRPFRMKRIDVPKIRRLGTRFDISRVSDIRGELKTFMDHLEGNSRGERNLRKRILRAMKDKNVDFATLLLSALQVYLAEEGYQ